MIHECDYVKGKVINVHIIKSSFNLKYFCARCGKELNNEQLNKLWIKQN